jgi:hypothetical protein
MSSKKIIIKYLLVILLALIVFIVNANEHVSPQFNLFCVLIFAALKSFMFMFQSLQKVIDVSKNDTPYYQFLIFLSLNITLIILSFAIDYYCLYKAKADCFVGVQHTKSSIYIFIDFIFLSIMAFTNFGYGNLVATSMLAKFVLTLELLISYAFIIFILSDFISLKDSLAQRKRNGKSDE